MTRDPLMLTDTAMVLLRQYIDVFETEVLRLIWVKRMKHRINHRRTYITSPHLRFIVWEFMLEVEALWVCRDLVPIRQLDQHFALNDDFLAQFVRSLPHRPLRSVPPNNLDLEMARFVADVVCAYQKTLPPHSQQPALNKDRSCPTNP